jgi:hypothetical protein
VVVTAVPVVGSESRKGSSSFSSTELSCRGLDQPEQTSLYSRQKNALSFFVSVDRTVHYILENCMRLRKLGVRGEWGSLPNLAPQSANMHDDREVNKFYSTKTCKITLTKFEK